MDGRHLWLAVPLLSLAPAFVKVELWTLAPVWGLLALYFSRYVWGGGLASGLAPAAAYMAVWAGLGLVFGFEANRYGGSPTATLLNGVYFGLAALAREFARYAALSLRAEELYLLGPPKRLLWSRGDLWTGLVSTALAVDASWLSPSPQWVGLSLVPSLSISHACSLLQRRYGPFASLPLATVWGALPYVSPAVPKSPWVLYGLVHLLLLLGVMAEDAPRRDLIPAVGAVALAAFLVGAFGVRPFVVATGSMSPLYQPGDVVFVVPIRHAEVGDVVLYRADFGYVLHRVIDVREVGGRTYYITKGDANPTPDARPVPQEAVLGKAVFKVPYVGTPALWARDPSSWPLLAVLLAAAAGLEHLLKTLLKRS
ncbi:signal peptidase I [Pyrobaculum neutrophilum]|uniref:Peptidase S26B, signal peptidase n=1 Tax=Pyrobaculum neutrophilum (strain DSM 2338 / JCM 9278 / NBRC 100436 / V24Sta) TaxID=444157 RepID=B1YDQ5_PYRNV|nr:signal peptidase I [Pyrobaculum neutrophilum]ACB39918.1 peptidase S26B, signal peptidase [Pyrobaculum neutrophilum V24Sta]